MVDPEIYRVADHFGDRGEDVRVKEPVRLNRAFVCAGPARAVPVAPRRSAGTSSRDVGWRPRLAGYPILRGEGAPQRSQTE